MVPKEQSSTCQPDYQQTVSMTVSFTDTDLYCPYNLAWGADFSGDPDTVFRKMDPKIGNR
jgi:hypothetical protein